MIDLHLHTTASDGVLTPAELVTLAARAGITTLSVTDHDTTAALAEARETALRLGAVFVDGIEITAVENGRDVHVLGYFFDPGSRGLREFLEAQRAERRRRVVLIAERLGDVGVPVNIDAILERAGGAHGRTVGRPALADALVASGYVASRREAFDRWLGEGQPAFVPRCGARPHEVIDVIHRAEGLASLAHPGLLKMDDLIESLASHGLDAVEARHSDHDEDVECHYRNIAARLGLAVSGGSDYHGEDGRLRELGDVVLPEADFSELAGRVSERRRA